MNDGILCDDAIFFWIGLDDFEFDCSACAACYESIALANRAVGWCRSYQYDVTSQTPNETAKDAKAVRAQSTDQSLAYLRGNKA